MPAEPKHPVVVNRSSRQLPWKQWDQTAVESLSSSEGDDLPRILVATKGSRSGTTPIASGLQLQTKPFLQYHLSSSPMTSVPPMKGAVVISSWPALAPENLRLGNESCRLLQCEHPLITQPRSQQFSVRIITSNKQTPCAVVWVFMNPPQSFEPYPSSGRCHVTRSELTATLRQERGPLQHGRPQRKVSMSPLPLHPGMP